MAYNHQERRQDIDWLRILAFGVLIIYHVGMYYVADWGWHIKSDRTSVFLQNVMMITNPWRMSLMFFISAIALGLVMQKYGPSKLAWQRTKRLIVPLLFGMFLVVVPQIYYEALSQDLIKPGIVSFWLDYINPRTDLLKEHHTIIGLLTWNHLWFLPYVWLYSLLFIALQKPITHTITSKWFSKLTPTTVILVVIILFTLIWMSLRLTFPPTHALINDWYNHGKYLLVFSLGYAFVWQRSWWQFVIVQRRVFLIFALLGYTLITLNRHDVFQVYADQINTNLFIRSIYGLVLSLNHWAWLFCIIGFAGFWLNKPNQYLKYASKAILPWYIFHQTLIIVFAWWLKPLQMSAISEGLMLISLTVAGCLIAYEIVKRNAALRFLCGVTPEQKK